MSAASNNGRIVYVEPNDIYDKVNNQPLTPDYTDYCMYCNLIVEKTSRLKNSYTGNDYSNSFAISSNLSENEQGVNYVSFFTGESENYNYLTTDYSNIHFNSVKERTFIEGLQITGIDINYANRMSPMVTINMVDIRGAGLFGREESTHVNGGLSGFERDNEGNIIDNIYSGFMSFPYPRYKLHIKGFYGRAVTYQLSCSSFNGKFDSNTGNFNITATFIGYEYGCLQDLPLSYVMAAPFTKSGKAYWEENKYSPKWNLFIKGENYEAPILMHDFFRNVKSAVEKKGTGDSLLKNIADTSLEEVEKDYAEKINVIGPITTQMEKFKETLIKSNGQPGTFIYDINDEESNGDKVLVIFSKNSNINITKEVANAYNSIGDLISEYVKLYPQGKIGLNMIPNNLGGTWEIEDRWKPCNVTIPQFIKKTDRRVIAVSTTQFEKQIPMTDGEYELDDSRVRIKRFNGKGDYSFNSKQSVEIHKALKTDLQGGMYPYAAVIVCDKWKKISGILEDLNEKQKLYKENDGSLIPITSITGGVTPYIGNYFKMVMCHVDTFIHTLESCAEDIYREVLENNREPEKLGVYSQAMTDVPSDLYSPGVNKGVIPPFPAIYKNYDADGYDNSYLSEDSTKMVGWVGDVKGSVPWREQALIEEYYNALKQIEASTSDVPWTSFDKDTLVFNLLPCFINDKQDKTPFTTRDGMAYYVATMSSLVLGAMNTTNVSPEEAELIGAVLAKNLYDGVKDKELLVRTKPDGDSFKTDLYNISTISDINGNDEAKRFEFAYGNSSDRKHRILSKTDGDNLKYSYMLTTNKKPIIPLNSFKEWSELAKQYTFNNGNGSWFVPNQIVDGPYVITQRGDDFVNANRNVTKQSYMNSYMFSIWLDACNVETIETNYNNYKNGGEKIGPYSKDKFTKHILNKYWKMSDNFEKYQTISTDKLVRVFDTTPNLSEEGITKAQLDKIINLKY